MKNSLLNVPSDNVQSTKGPSDQVQSDQVQCTNSIGTGQSNIHPASVGVKG